VPAAIGAIVALHVIIVLLAVFIYRGSVSAGGKDAPAAKKDFSSLEARLGRLGKQD
jgi:hypothetical protein